MQSTAPAAAEGAAPLLQPLQLGAIPIANRIIMAPLTRAIGQGTSAGCAGRHLLSPTSHRRTDRN